MRKLQVAAGCLLAVVALVAATPASAQWADEFNGSGAVSSGNWTYDTGGGGFGNNELQCYNSGSANATQTGGYLRIQAKREAGCNARAYTSARIKTQGIRNFGPYGRLEGRMQGPMAQGLWPAFWMLGSNISSVPWPGCGEIDVMEHINAAGNVLGTIHWDFGGYASYTAMNRAVSFSGWNNYAIEWNSSYIRWLVNGAASGDANIAGSINGTDEFHRSFFIILNLAVGGNWPGPPAATTTFPQNFNIDWVRWGTGGGSATPTPTNPPSATPTPAPSGSIVLNAWYDIVNRNSNKCVDARGSGTANGTVVQQYTCNNSFAQHWQFQDAGGGYRRVNTRNAVPQVWDVSGVSTANGAKIHLWSYGNAANQQWLPESLGGGYWRFRARHSGRCLDVPGMSTAESLQLQQWDCNGSNAQSFYLRQK